MIGEKKICQNEKMLVGIGHMCVPPHTYGMLLFDSLPEMLFLHTISSWGSARVSPPTFALLAHRRPAIKNPPKKRKKNQAAAAAALPKKTTRSITHALLHFIWEEKSQQQQDIFIRDATSLFFPYGRVESLLVPKRRRRRDMPLRGALNTISTSICVYGAAATCCHFLLLASAAFSKKKKWKKRARHLVPQPSPVAKKKMLFLLLLLLLLFVMMENRLWSWDIESIEFDQSSWSAARENQIVVTKDE